MSEQMLTYECGCTNVIDESSGALYCIHKCNSHTCQKEGLGSDKEYYDSMMKVEPEQYIKELKDALGPRLDYLIGGSALEIGCGMSPYIGWLQDLGYRYVGVDTRKFACDWVMQKFSVTAINEDFKNCQLLPGAYDLVLMMHILEHLDGAPDMLTKAVASLKHYGFMIIIVPDDEDPVNPDHEWFFSTESLGICMAKSGLTNIRVEKRKIIERESFLYAIGEKR